MHRIRSFVRREGRITSAQSRALKQLLPQYKIPDSEDQIDFSEIFPKSDKVAIEVGFGTGALLVQMAANNPQTGYLGIEVYRSGIGRLLLQMENLGLSNIRIAEQDAYDVLCERVEPQSIDEIYVMFPDPWPKKRHAKRRLIQPKFSVACANCLKSSGQLFVATDIKDYAIHSLAVLEVTPGLQNVAGKGFATRFERANTRFEQRAVVDDRAVFDLIFQKI